MNSTVNLGSIRTALREKGAGKEAAATLTLLLRKPRGRQVQIEPDSDEHPRSLPSPSYPASAPSPSTADSHHAALPTNFQPHRPSLHPGITKHVPTCRHCIYLHSALEGWLLLIAQTSAQISPPEGVSPDHSILSSGPLYTDAV